MADYTCLTDTEAGEICNHRDAATKDFVFIHTMYRNKDPRKTLSFYGRVLGMTLLQKVDFPDGRFSLYFLGFEGSSDFERGTLDHIKWVMRRQATLELTHNWGTEDIPDHSYHSGNTEPRGYGHIAIKVPDVNVACKRFEELGVEFAKTPDGGRMKGFAFIKDPDGYWIEIFDADTVTK